MYECYNKPAGLKLRRRGTVNSTMYPAENGDRFRGFPSTSGSRPVVLYHDRSLRR